MSIDMRMLCVMESAPTCGLARLVEMAFNPCADTAGWMLTSTDQMLRDPSSCRSERLGGRSCVC